jgi:hypothetical protein
MGIEVHVALSDVDAAGLGLVIHLGEETIELGGEVRKQAASCLGNNVFGVLQLAQRQAFELLIRENIEDRMAELAVAHFSLLAERVDKVLEFILRQRELEEFEASAKTIDRHAAAPQFVKVLEPIVRVDVVQVNVRPEPVKQIAGNRHCFQTYAAIKLFLMGLR